MADFCRIPDSKCFQLCGTYYSCYSYSPLPLLAKSSRRQHEYKGAWLYAIHINKNRQPRFSLWLRVCPVEGPSSLPLSPHLPLVCPLLEAEGSLWGLCSDECCSCHQGVDGVEGTFKKRYVEWLRVCITQNLKGPTVHHRVSNLSFTAGDSPAL